MAKCVRYLNQPIMLMRKFFLLLPILVLAACSGGSSGGAGIAVQGPTTHAGFWTLRAVITAIVGGGSNLVETESFVRIEDNGAVSILQTNTDCALSIFVNGNTITYRETCLFAGAATETSPGAPCTLEMESKATFTSNVSASGTFGPETLECLGSVASYSGTLVALREGTLPLPTPTPTPTPTPEPTPEPTPTPSPT